MTDLDLQLRTYFEGIAPPHDPEDLTVERVGAGAVRPIRPRTPARRSWLVAAAAAVVMVLLVGGVAWLTRSIDPAEQPVPPTISIPPPAELTTTQANQQDEFVAAFGQVGRCSGPAGGPFECRAEFDLALFESPRVVTVTVTATDDEFPALMGDDGGAISSAARQVLEPELAALYEWALATYPDTTEELCGIGFRGSEEFVAWTPGYRASPACGLHLASLIAEYKPEETAARQLVPPAQDVGSWYPADGARGASVFFSVARTPVGLIATSFDGLWISVDEGHSWEPYVRDQITFGPDSSFARVAHSDVGTLVIDTFAGDAWLSPDGDSWNPVEPPPIEAGWSVDLHGLPRGFVASYHDGVLHSVDGLQWERIASSSRWGLVETPTGYLSTSDDGDMARVWFSTDGLDWQQTALDAQDGFFRIAGSARGMVAISVDDFGRWQSLWHSANGVDWVEIEEPGLDRRLVFYTVVASDIGFFAIASMEPTTAVDERIVTGWFSEDGRSWSLVPYEGDETQDLASRGAIPTEDGFVIYGDAFETPTNVWIYER